MREPINLQIEEMVLHILDPERRDGRAHLGFVPSHGALALHNNPAVAGYFTQHIERSLRSPTAKAAAFKNINLNAASGKCAGMLDGSVSLVEGSVDIARALYQILDSDQRTKPGDLAVGTYRAANYPNERFLALLKIDPSQVFRHQVLRTPGGSVVTLDAAPEAFTDKELQKCAFIRPLAPRHEEFDMILLDRLVDVSQYFKDDLLDAEERYDTKQRTRRLYQAVTAAHNTLRDGFSDEENASLEAQKEALFDSRRTNVDDWLETLNLPEAAVSEIDEQIRRRLPDREFNIDTEFGGKLVEKRYFAGDFGLKVQFQALHYEDVIESEEPIVDGEGKVVGRRVVLNALNWREVAR